MRLRRRGAGAGGHPDGAGCRKRRRVDRRRALGSLAGGPTAWCPGPTGAQLVRSRLGDCADTPTDHQRRRGPSDPPADGSLRSFLLALALLAPPAAKSAFKVGQNDINPVSPVQLQDGSTWNWADCRAADHYNLTGRPGQHRELGDHSALCRLFHLRRDAQPSSTTLRSPPRDDRRTAAGRDLPDQPRGGVGRRHSDHEATSPHSAGRQRHEQGIPHAFTQGTARSRR